MSDIWEHYGHIKLVTAPEMSWLGRWCWFQGDTVFIGPADGDMVRYSSGMMVFSNFIPPHRGQVKKRPGKRVGTIVERCDSIVDMAMKGFGWPGLRRRTSTA